MAKLQTLVVPETEIRLVTESAGDFFSLTDIARRFNERTDQLILNWLRTRNTIDFPGAWETLHNPNFNPLNFEGIRNQAGATAERNRHLSNGIAAFRSLPALVTRRRKCWKMNVLF